MYKIKYLPYPTALAFLLCVCLSLQSLIAQAPYKPNAAELQLAINKLNVLGSALHIAAHPDDENSGLLAYLANEELIETAYLSLTRGDGGQNLIGTELRESLGAIRTQELLEARKIDGAKQFFSRANDFGFSKHPDETFKIWDKEQVLADVVWIIRKFRPDVLITRFSTEPGITHGHHTASAILAEEAFEIAGNPDYFPEQLEYVEVWQPKKLLYNASWRTYGSKEAFEQSGDKAKMIPVDIGVYNPLMGLSYTEVAAESRSQHRCQAMGRIGKRGQKVEYLLPLKGDMTTDGLFAGINTSWSRIKNGAPIGRILEEAAIGFDPMNPADVVPQLLKAREKIAQLKGEDYWKNLKLQEIDQLIYHCSGMYLEAIATNHLLCSGDKIDVVVEALNRSDLNVQLKNVSFVGSKKDTSLNKTLKYNQKLSFNTQVRVAENKDISQAYWLQKDPSLGMFEVDNQMLVGLPNNPSQLALQFTLDIEGQNVNYIQAIVHKWQDDGKGELYRSLVIAPPVTANIQEKVMLFADDKPQNVAVLVKNLKGNTQAKVSLIAPNKEWVIEPAFVDLKMDKKGSEQSINFQITPPKNAQSSYLEAHIEVDGKNYNYAQQNIEYDHIAHQTLFPKSQVQVVKLDIKKTGEKIGYIKGAGDLVPVSLRQIGYTVDELNIHNISLSTLQTYDAVVLGIRLFNTQKRAPHIASTLFEYVKKGGTVIAQYNTTYSLISKEVAPYNLNISRDRVTDETAKIDILNPEHPALNVPNKITQADFDNWVQERGLYFPNEWDENFVPLLACNDEGEDSKKGSLLVAPYGEGHFVYTALSFFRQLPAGVPGAYRLFVNLLSLGDE